MARNVDSATLLEVAKNQTAMAHLYYGAWGNGNDLRLTDSAFDITTGGNTYNATAGLLSIDTVEESPQIKVNETTISLSGLDASVVYRILVLPLIGIPQFIWRVYLDELGQVVGQPILIHSGFSDGAEIKEDNEKVLISLKSRDKLSNFEKRVGRRTNDSEHRQKYPNDRCFQYIANLVDKQIAW